MIDTADKVRNVLYKFANSFDVKDWQGLEETLNDEIWCDYKSLRGNASVNNKSDYIHTRKESLHHLKTQHLFSNLEIEVQGENAYCRLSAVIYRENNQGNYFNTHAVYNFELSLSKTNVWKIRKISQQVLWNRGDSSIHSGVSEGR
ncbi:nuclear transport factor 2 family protein [Piscirickettsia litoralis]|uniref:SnoaL-like domain-containing protein n=1 Tax=Piscirickettsia litoralis TaxID=1891921 RepID=A0ABX3A1M0_9GAMM|nr:nuclear transport factor 2 family protein [Piscirickettsia litoralis]ODN42534.1 hypothetical protein BGC07_05825 [Piscirickettsia litoralis]